MNNMNIDSCMMTPARRNQNRRQPKSVRIMLPTEQVAQLTRDRATERIELETDDLDDLANYEEAQLRRWAQENLAAAPVDQSRQALESLIRQRHTFCSPGSSSSKRAPRRPTTDKRSVRKLRFAAENESGSENENEDGDEQMENMDGFSMQICFDDC